MSLLDSNQFTELYPDTTDGLGRKVKNTFRNVKTKLPSNIYSKVYPTGFSPSKLYGTAKIHEIDTNGKVDYLPVIPIILNNVTLNIVPPCKVFGRVIETFQWISKHSKKY